MRQASPSTAWDMYTPRIFRRPEKRTEYNSMLQGYVDFEGMRDQTQPAMESFKSVLTAFAQNEGFEISEPPKPDFEEVALWSARGFTLLASKPNDESLKMLFEPSDDDFALNFQLESTKPGPEPYYPPFTATNSGVIFLSMVLPTLIGATQLAYYAILMPWLAFLLIMLNSANNFLEGPHDNPIKELLDALVMWAYMPVFLIIFPLVDLNIYLSTRKGAGKPYSKGMTGALTCIKESAASQGLAERLHITDASAPPPLKELGWLLWLGVVALCLSLVAMLAYLPLPFLAYPAALVDIAYIGLARRVIPKVPMPGSHRA